MVDEVGAMRFGLLSRIDLPEALEVAGRTLNHLKSRGLEALVEEGVAEALGVEPTPLGEMEVDLLVVVGGDGTLLRAAMGLRNPETPMLGVDMGRRGFLAEVSPEEVEEAIERILRGDYRLEECLKLSSRCGGQLLPDALNEVLVATSKPSKMAEMEVYVDGTHLITLQADGVLVATPTGSTAYNLSAGGSILTPGVEAMILTAVSPYSYFRSVVLPSGSRVEIEVRRPRAGALAIVDGSFQAEVKPGSRVEVWASSHRARFIRFDSFYKRLRRRLPL
ncbi:MAG: inorganic polyphosphate/ATP-NAD kinase [Candidatus Bathyarchaeota archaeon B23]|nr:MAG: inorganic polyphosphate/ATP-NAD kinase [Candidatus Bathyarchaeota archaeon B23]